MNKILLTLITITFYSLACSAEPIQDNFVNEWFKDKEINYIEPTTDYNFESLKRTKITLSPTKKISTKKDIYDGQIIELQVKRTARIENRLLKKRTKAHAVMELYTTNGMSGIPGTITLGRINIDGIDNSKLRYYYVKKGQDRTLWILPLKWALTFIPFAGTFTNLIRGGHAILSPADDITIFYYE